jgi:hypothetical protein
MAGKVSDERWKDPEITFFEPTVGHGAILVVMAQKRFECLTALAEEIGSSKPRHMAVALTLDALRGVDASQANVDAARRRLWEAARFWIHQSQATGAKAMEQDFDFLIQAGLAITHNIQLREGLASLAPRGHGSEAAQQTSVGQAFNCDQSLKQKSLRPIDFRKKWSHQNPKTIIKAQRSVERAIAGSKKCRNEFLWIAAAIRQHQILDLPGLDA